MRSKFAVLILIILAATSVSAFSVKEWKDSFFNEIKVQGEKALSDLFQTKVRISSAGGSILGQIIFNDVTIPGMGQAAHVILNYNPIKYALNKGDMVPSLNSVILSEGRLKVTRGKNNQWNFMVVVPKPTPGAPPGPVFAAKLIISKCVIDYADEVGFGSALKMFNITAKQVNGQLDFSKKDKLGINLNFKIPESIKANGNLNFKTGKYELNVSASRLDLERWGNYGLVVPDLKVTGGSADCTIKLTPPKLKGWAVSINGKATLFNGSLQFQTYQLNKINGGIAINDSGLNIDNLNGELNHILFSVNGHFGDFTKQLLALTLSIPSADLKTARGILPATRGLELSGNASADLKLTGPLTNPAVSGSVKVADGLFYQQKFNAGGNFTLADQRLSAEVRSADLYHGNTAAKIDLDLTKKDPLLHLSAKFEHLSLFNLAQNSPGINGTANGALEIYGTVNDLSGRLGAGFNQARIFGQSVQSLASSFSFKEGDFNLDSLNISSTDSAINAHGKIGRELSFDLLAEARGLRLSGNGVLGKMGVTVDKFSGDVHWKLDRYFLASPLKNINASGEAVLSAGQIGDQLIDRAQGKIRIGGGKIEVSDTFLQRNHSSARVSGQTGIGTPTRLKISGDNVDLKDLKIINQFVPASYQDPTGSVTIEAEITGELSKETQINSPNPLLDLSAQGKISLLNASLAGIPINKALFNFSWQDHSLEISKGFLSLPDSNLVFSLASKNDGSINASIEGVAELSLFSPLTKELGRISGQLGINLKAAGNLKDPVVTASFWLNPLRFDDFRFDSISGSLDYRGRRLIIIKPILIQDGQYLYSLSGSLTASSENLADSFIDLDFKVVQADLSGVYKIINNLQAELARRLSVHSEKMQKINLSNLFFPNPPRQSKIKLYSSEGNKKSFIKRWSDAVASPGPSRAEVSEEHLGGRLSGGLQAKGKVGNPSGKCDLKIDHGHFSGFTFDDLTLSADLKNQEIKIGQALLTKDQGSLSVRGKFNFKNQISLNIIANNLTLDALKAVFPNKEFKGNFNMNAGIDGPLQDPDISVSAAGSGIGLAGVNFDKATFSFTKRKSLLYLHELSLMQGNLLSGAYGSVDLSPSGRVSLEADLHGDAIGLVNLFTDEIKWIQGNSAVKASLRGKLDAPTINGTLQIKGGTLQVRSLNSELRNIQADIAIDHDLMNIRQLGGVWVGEGTRNWNNSISLVGTIDLSKAFVQKGEIDLNLACSPTRLYASFPNLYVGAIDIKELSLQGPLRFDLSQGPLLKGRLAADNAVITLPQGAQAAPAKQVLPLRFDLSADLNKNVYVVMGDVSTLNLSNIFMNLEIAGQGMKIGGSLKAPSLLGKISIKRGTVDIFNREFTLVSADDQKKYYPYDAEKIRDNLAAFYGEEGSAGILPSIDITSSVKVENLQKNESGWYVKKNVLVLARLQGVPGSLEKDRGMQITLSGFTEDNTKSPPEIIPAAYSEQDLRVMLLPDFIKAMAGIGQQGENSQVDTNAVVADYVSSRFQTILFRSLERQAEQSLGLESLTLEYNLGPKVREAMGIKEPSGFMEDKPTWNVGFVKGIFDRLYIDVRYSQWEQSTTGTGVSNTNFNYQLTYKLTPIWSIIYYREPVSLTDITTGYQKITVKAGFALW